MLKALNLIYMIFAKLTMRLKGICFIIADGRNNLVKTWYVSPLKIKLNESENLLLGEKFHLNFFVENKSIIYSVIQEYTLCFQDKARKCIYIFALLLKLN